MITMERPSPKFYNGADILHRVGSGGQRRRAGGNGPCALGLGPFCYSADDAFAHFSNFGPEIDVIAPGAQIYSTDKDGTPLRTASSTSS